MSIPEVNSAKEIAEAVRKLVEKLNRPGWPHNGRCSHLGVCVPWSGPDYLSVTSRNERLQVMVYRKYWSEEVEVTTGPACVKCGHQTTITQRRSVHPGSPKAVHDERIAALVEVFGPVYQSWNGGEGHSGVSIVFERPAPEALSRCQDNTSGLFPIFDAWLAA